jgi:hypothetical protein
MGKHEKQETAEDLQALADSFDAQYQHSKTMGDAEQEVNPYNRPQPSGGQTSWGQE